MGTKMGPSYANLFVGYIETNFSPTTKDQKLIFINAIYTSMTASVLLHPAEKNSTYLSPRSILFTRAKIHLGNFWKFISFPRD